MKSNRIRIFQLIVLAVVAGFIGVAHADSVKRTSTTGAVFTQIINHPELGDAWLDPSGLIWGDTPLDSDGNPINLNHADATQYCAKIGARLTA